MTELQFFKEDIEKAIADYTQVVSVLKENINALDARMIRGILYHRKMNLGLCYYFCEKHKLKTLPYMLDNILDKYIKLTGNQVWLSEFPHAAKTVADMMWRLELRLETLNKIIADIYHGNILQEKQHID